MGAVNTYYIVVSTRCSIATTLLGIYNRSYSELESVGQIYRWIVCKNPSLATILAHLRTFQERNADVLMAYSAHSVLDNCYGLLEKARARLELALQRILPDEYHMGSDIQSEAVSDSGESSQTQRSPCFGSPSCSTAPSSGCEIAWDEVLGGRESPRARSEGGNWDSDTMSNKSSNTI